MIGEDYLTYTIFGDDPPRFMKTTGGYYSQNDNRLQAVLEFNSNYAKDSISSLDLNYSLQKDSLLIAGLAFKKAPPVIQDLDGQWLFATRGPDTGQERRGDANPRKTLKFLLDGHFQWIAYNTESFDFFGSGGGSFTADGGIYRENINFFSRDDSRVGAKLVFEYEIKEGDWHHTGKNSKGEPMYEIWAKR